VHGRDREQAAIGALLQDAQTGAGGALVLLGDPGVGKSVLLVDTVRGTATMTVLRTAGIESEAPLAFAALHRLLRPVLRFTDGLPAPQQHALRVAFGQETGGNSDRFLVFLGALSLLAEAAGELPVLAVIDDAHWLDEASAAALLFIARRVQMEPVAMLFAARDSDARTFDSGDLPRLRLKGLDLGAVTTLLAEQSHGEVSTEVSAQLLASTGGNPLALIELPEVLTAEQLRGEVPLPGRLPITERVERVFLERARRLSTQAQQLLLVAAVDDSTRVATVLRAAAKLDVPTEALTEVERSGLVAVDDEHLLLRHPLVRSALYSAATSAERRQVHAALAHVLTRADDVDRRAWHRSAATVEPDESVVADLADAALRAQQRGGHEAAAAAWQRAAELSSDPHQRATRLFHAARAAWAAGHPAQARPLVEAVVRETLDPLLRADSTRLLARLEWNGGSVRLAHRMLLQAAEDVAPHDADRAREIATEATAIAAFGGHSGSRIDPARFVGSPPTDAPARQRCYAAFLQGLIHVVAGEWKQAVPPLRLAFEIHRELEGEYELLPNLTIGALHIGDYMLAERYYDRLLTQARSTGVMVMTLYVLSRLPYTDVAAGRWADAVSHAAEAVSLGEETAQPVLADSPRTWLLLMAALRHDEAAFDSLAAQLAAVMARESAGVLDVLLRDTIRWAHGVHTFAQPSAAFHHLAQISHDLSKRLAGMDRIEAAVRADQPAAAALWVEDLAAFAEATDQPWAAAVAEHGRALLAPDADRESHFHRALELHAAGDRPFDRARTQLAYGEFLRRSRRRVDAREHLRSALQTFTDLPAPVWADRAAAELRASGETVRKRDDVAPTALTPQERQVAQLVRQGLSNRDVAAQLFVSPRTVDFHLRNVFTKLGVTSRAALAALTLD
jgi:DNA-binding NarL/FixJ family response regulator